MQYTYSMFTYYADSQHKIVNKHQKWFKFERGGG
jgi:hypothetical protein